MTATTEPTTADLAAELASLRAEFHEWRNLLADEVRTRRLVIDDHEGTEFITAEVTEQASVLTVRYIDKEDRARLGVINESYVSLRAEGPDSRHDDGEEIIQASVICSTGDGYATMQQVQVYEEPHCLTERGHVEVHRTPYFRDSKGKMRLHHDQTVRLDFQGVASSIDGNVDAYAPMHRTR